MSDHPTNLPTIDELRAYSEGKAGVERLKPTLQIVPHPKAPLFSGPDAELVLSQAIAEMTSPNAEISNKAAKEVLRQAGFVSLWFLLKFIAGHTGPFDLLNDDLHIDMCNIRQRWLTPGARGAMFIPRNHYKSTVCTEGGSIWELLRNPDLRIRISNAIAEKAETFMHTARSFFDSNELAAELYTEYYIFNPKSQERWNEKEMVLPNRTKRYREPSIHGGGVTGASEGYHVDLHVVDDMLGLAALNAMRQSNAIMLDTRNWFWASANKSILISLKSSRVIVIGTRYSIDDVYSEIIQRGKVNIGWPLRDFVPDPKGRWEIYYRMGVEDGRVIFPEMADLEDYLDMADSDWWGYVTQFLNDPQGAGLTEWSDFNVRSCSMVFDDVYNRWFITYELNHEMKKIALSECDVIQACDPAATERYVSAKTSRTAVGVLATDSKNRKFLIDLKVGFVPPSKMFDWLFANRRKFPLIRATFLEASGPFKLLEPLLRDEEHRRMEYLNLRPFAAAGDKDSRIRTHLEPELERQQLYVHDLFVQEFSREQKVFPQAQRKDILDMTATAVANVIRPYTEEETLIKKKEDEFFERRTSNVAGY